MTVVVIEVRHVTVEYHRVDLPDGLSDDDAVTAARKVYNEGNDQYTMYQDEVDDSYTIVPRHYIDGRRWSQEDPQGDYEV